MNINLGFRNKEQETFFWSKSRNNEYDGAFANGKTYGAMERAFVHLSTFGNYRMSICRQKYKILKATTMATFFKICPSQLIYRHNDQDGYTILINKSLIYWMHLDSYDEQDLRVPRPIHQHMGRRGRGFEIDDNPAHSCVTLKRTTDALRCPGHSAVVRRRLPGLRSRRSV